MRVLFASVAISLIAVAVSEEILTSKLGGKQEQDASSPEWVPLAELALSAHLKRVGDVTPHDVIKILHVTTQVVAGSLTDLEFLASPPGDSARSLHCTASIWERSWLHSTEVVEVACQPGIQ